MELKYYIICFGIMVGCQLVLASLPKNQLQTAFHHRVVAKNTMPSVSDFLELGKLILAFHHEPIVEVKAGAPKEQSLRERIFFFPMTSVQGPECKEMLASIQAQQSPFYTLTFTEVEKPAPGFLCTVRYNSTAVGMTYAVIENEGQQRRLIMTFYNKSLIKKIDESHAHILQTAQRKGKPGVIVDCGHGGHDSGAQGHHGLVEKEVNLEIGILLASLLRKQGFDVFLTRSSDVFVALDERTLMNERNNDAVVFVSIHANAAPNTDATGIETFFFDVEKSCPSGKIPSQSTVALMHNRCTASQLLARCIHEQVVAQVRRHNGTMVDREVKPAFLQVLTGAAIPAALVELGFLTNEKEAALMNDKRYRSLLAAGLCEGIVQYFKRLVA